jgi:hypothetical protein
MSYSPSSVDVADMIMRYLIAHPDACDSLEGICGWWLVRQQHDDVRLAAGPALMQLVASGCIEAYTGADGRTLYRAMPRHATLNPKDATA